MERFQGSVLLLLLLVISVSAGRPLSILPDQQRYSKILGSLGVVCKCCDGSGAGGDQPCSKLKCLPWKLH
ncbi:hypothetical protein GQ457_12G009920 [Hibiscus cannabinus]